MRQIWPKLSWSLPGQEFLWWFAVTTMRLQITKLPHLMVWGWVKKALSSYLPQNEHPHPPRIESFVEGPVCFFLNPYSICNLVGIIFEHLFLWMMALKARPSRHDWVKSWTLTPGYLWVVFWAHRRSASFADRSSWPTTMSEIWKRKGKQSVLIDIWNDGYTTTDNNIDLWEQL